MENRKILISKVCCLNQESITNDDDFRVIEYLDTGNITNNKIVATQLLKIGIDEIPSRAKRKVKSNSIIYSTVRPNQEHFGFLENPPKNFIVSTGFTTIDVTDVTIDPKYLYYAITQKNITDYLQSIAENSVSSYPSINPSDLGNLTFSIPKEKREQEKISKVLSIIDAKIEFNNRINAELEVMAETLYNYWFVQFDFPFDFIQGKPAANGKPYKTFGGKMVYNSALKREIPEGWEVSTLWNIAKYSNGLAMQKYRPTDEEFLPVIKIREMNEGYSDSTERARADLPNNAIVNDGDILFSWSATLDVKIWSQGRGALNQHIFKVTSDNYPKTFYYFELLNYLNHFKMMAKLRKTTMGHITLDHLKQAKISLPPLEILEQADQFIEPVLKKHLMLEKENRTLGAIRDWLLPMLMNGQVTVK